MVSINMYHINFVCFLNSLGKLEPTLDVSDVLLKLEQELEQIKAEGCVRNENLDIIWVVISSCCQRKGRRTKFAER